MLLRGYLRTSLKLLAASGSSDKLLANEEVILIEIG
jgi:hypothetical protein